MREEPFRGVGGGGTYVPSLNFKTYRSHTEEEATYLLVFYYFIFPFLCCLSVLTHLCVTCCHFSSLMLIFQGLVTRRNLTLTGPHKKNAVVT